MRLVVALVSLMLASSAFAEDDMLFAPDSNLRSQTVSGEEITWEPTFKSAQKIKFDKTVLRPAEKRSQNREARSASTVSQISALRQTVVVPSTVSFVVGFDAYTAVLDHVEYAPSGAYSWFGMVPGALTLSHFTVVGDAVAGNVWGPDGLERSIITRGGETFLVEMDDRKVSELLSWCEVREDREYFLGMGNLEMQGFQGRVVPVPDPTFSRVPVPPREPEVISPCGEDEVLASVVDLLYFYDKTTLDWFKGDVNAVLAFTQNAANDINVSLKNSRVVGYVNLLHVVDFTAYTSIGKIGDDHNFFALSKVMMSAQEQHHADIVGLFVAPSPSTADAGGVSSSYRPGSWAGNVSVAWGGCTISRHEFGHPFGPNHQREFAPPPEYMYSPYAYGRFLDRVYRDAMSYGGLCPNGCPDNPPSWSNPEVVVDGWFPTGVAGESDNARVLRETFAQIAGNYDGSQPKCIRR